MITFIRHAQSIYNLKVEEHLTKCKLKSFDWQTLSKDHIFLDQVKYSHHLIDTPISQYGKKQCQKVRGNLLNLNPDLILVSPLERTLNTFTQIFQEANCPIIAEPILAQGFRSACDLAIQTEEKKKQFPKINFEKVQKQGPYWFINNDSQQNRVKYHQVIGKNIEKSHSQKLKQILSFMRQTFIYETPANIRRRTEQLRILLSEYGKTYKNIVIVSHYNIIRYSLAKQFDERDEPIYPTVANCEVKQIQLKQL